MERNIDFAEVNFKNVVLWSLWLPITSFSSLKKSFMESSETVIKEKDRNNTWSWIIFEYQSTLVTMDSLGFVYLENVDSQEELDNFLSFFVKMLNSDTKMQITDTFLNREIGYVREKKSNEDKELERFFQNIIVPFMPIENRVKLEYIYSSLYVNLTEQGNNEELESKYKISSMKDMKFSLDSKEEIDNKFQTILNRNFESLLKKSIHHTHSLYFDKGEIYNLSILDIKHNITDWVQFELFINKSDKTEKRDKIFNQILKKAIQDTLEEYTIFNFLKVTRRKYLRNITEKISTKNRLLKKLNAYLLDDTGKSLLPSEQQEDSSDDEATVEIFIQNLLQSMPKFYSIDAKIKEAYYVKIGNTSTNLRVNVNETIVNTLYYAKWKSSIQFFVETATKVNDSLTMYHQNKTRKELEDISYNANYQADIEDIRELQKNKLLSLDENSKKILFFIAIAALAGEAPLIDSKLWFYLTPDKLTLFEALGSNLFDIMVNSLIYGGFIYYFIRPYIFQDGEYSDKNESKNLGVKRVLNFFKKRLKGYVAPKEYTFDESDYDKHEHRSSKLLLTYNKEGKDFEKIHIDYNNSISSYQLVQRLKKIRLTQHLMFEDKTFSYDLFPKILKDAPLGKDSYVHRENYRISGNDRIATKVMYRYKISNLKLEELLDFMKRDEFLEKYGAFLKKQGYSLKDEYAILESEKKGFSFITLYIVYSFILKFVKLKENGDYRYTVSKDQFRVHYHINKLDYKDESNFEAKQRALATLIDIYFITRLKRLERD